MTKRFSELKSLEAWEMALPFAEKTLTFLGRELVKENQDNNKDFHVGMMYAIELMATSAIHLFTQDAGVTIEKVLDFFVNNIKNHIEFKTTMAVMKNGCDH